MLFRAQVAFLSLFCIFQGGIAALTPDEVVSNVQLLTKISGNINLSLRQLTTSSTSATVVSIGQSVVSNFTVIVNGLKNDISAMNATPQFSDDAAVSIVNALSDFVIVHQLLLSTVIGKHSIFAQFAVTAPITAILRTLEATIDSFAFSMINLIPTRKSDVDADKTKLDGSVVQTITTYSQVCIPSPLYPITQPICLP